MPLRLLALLLLLAGCSAHRAQQHETSHDLSPIVLLIDADTGKTFSNSAVVIRGGVMASAMNPHQWPRRIQIVTEDGRRHDSAGVLDYRFGDKGVLLLVDFHAVRGPSPVDLAAACPGPGDALRTNSPQRGSEGHGFEVEASSASRTSSIAGYTEFEGAPCWHPLLGPGVVLDAEGRLAGLAESWAIGMGLGLNPLLSGTSTFTAWRPEVLATLTPREVIPWEQWQQTQKSAHAALDIVYGLGDSPDRVAACREAIRLDPQCWQAWKYLGMALHEQKDYAGAHAALTQALAFIPTDGDALGSRSWSAMNLGRMQDALSDAENAVRLAPHHAGAHWGYGYVLRAAGRLEDAALECAEATRQDPKCFEAWKYRGTILYDLHEYVAAESALSQAITLKQTDAECFVWRALSALYLERAHDGLPDAQKAVALAPQNGEYRRVLAHLLDVTGKRREALTEYAEAVRLNPGDEYSSAELERLGKLLVPSRASAIELPDLDLRLTPEPLPAAVPDSPAAPPP